MSDQDEMTLTELIERVDDIRTVMVTTGDERGTLSSRPLTVQDISKDGDVAFMVGRSADWLPTAVEAANVAFVDAGNTWVSVSGRAMVDADAETLDELWDADADAFFPEGKDSAVVLLVQADRWEFWTAPNRLLQMVRMAPSQVTGGSPDLGSSGAVET